MCVTFTGCGLQCSETWRWQQSSHATLKPKLQIQIKRMVMKDKKRKTTKKKPHKGLLELRLNQANEQWGKSVRLFGFPSGCEEGHEPHMQRLLRRRPRLGHLHQPHIQAEVGRGPGVAATPSPPLGGKELGGLRQMDLEARESPGGYLVMPGKSH